jgi:hypothetical protein
VGRDVSRRHRHTSAATALTTAKTQFAEANEAAFNFDANQLLKAVDKDRFAKAMSQLQVSYSFLKSFSDAVPGQSGPHGQKDAKYAPEAGQTQL